MAKNSDYLKKVWHFIWHDDSLLSWVVNVILAFVLIKFIVYPALGWVLATTHPVVAVVSGSMEHDGSFDDWWGSDARCTGMPCTQREHYASLGITKDMFLNYRFRNGFNTGDIIILKGKDPEDIKPGDVIVFRGGKADPIIHRVVKTRFADGHYYYQTKGDHNPESIGYGPLSEINIQDTLVIGEARFRLPFLGWIKIAFSRLIGMIMIS